MDDDRVITTGFRFYPTEEELVSFYLHNKLNGTIPEIDRVIPLVHVYDYHPSDLPKLGGEYSPADGEQWFFFIPRQEREARGGRPNRLTSRGYWKATGSPGDVYSHKNGVIGRRRTMVFYMGRAPYGRKTLWKMNEYKALKVIQNAAHSPTAQLREEVSLCRIYKRSKCLRAFDRRPPPSETAHRHHHHRRDNQATATFNNQKNIPVVSRDHCSSSGGNTSNYNIYQSQSPEETNINGNSRDNAADSEAFWDWEQINWFDI